MRENLLGWLTKGQYEVSFLDTIIFLIELGLLIGIIYAVGRFIDFILELIKKKRNKKVRNKE